MRKTDRKYLRGASGIAGLNRMRNEAEKARGVSCGVMEWGKRDTFKY